jgi:hypothetical protein
MLLIMRSLGVKHKEGEPARHQLQEDHMMEGYTTIHFWSTPFKQILAMINSSEIPDERLRSRILID